LGVLVFTIHSLVAQSGLELLVEEIFDCELPRRLALKDRRVVVRLQWFMQHSAKSSSFVMMAACC
jgi:hypothetical protein